MSKRMKGFTCCGDCIHYNYKKHKCNLGASIETDAKNPFYDDCPIPDIPSEKEIRDKAIDDLEDKICSHFADWQYSEDDKWIKNIIELASESVEEIAKEMKVVEKNER